MDRMKNVNLNHVNMTFLWIGKAEYVIEMTLLSHNAVIIEACRSNVGTKSEAVYQKYY